jgi:hypothetical protein
MMEKMFWIVSGLLYASAGLLLLTDLGHRGAVALHWSVWVLIGLGTLAATIGNVVRPEKTPAR